MAYIRFDQMQQNPIQPLMMGADGYTKGGYASYSPTLDHNVLYKEPPKSYIPKTPYIAPPILEIRGIQDLMKQIGYPDIVDGRRGGIAVWSGSTLKKRKYGFLNRVEILDETIASTSPIKHFSNVYIWVPMVLSLEMLYNIHSLSKDYYYDRKKELMIIRSDTLNTCVSQAALIILYSNNKLSFYNIVNNDLLKIYYEAVKKPKTLKAMYTIVNTASN